MRQLSAYVAGALARPLPPPVVEKARQHVLDTLAAMISGAQLRPGRLAIAYVSTLGGAGQSSVVGTRLLTCPIHAALANGMLAHADETDDSHAASRTHPGCAVIPAALSVGESVRASGEGLLRAVVLGYDVATRVNYALGPDALAEAARGTHSVGGTFGAGAAAGGSLTVGSSAGAISLFLRAAGVRHYCSVRDSETSKRPSIGGMPARNGRRQRIGGPIHRVEDVFSGERNFFEAKASSRSRTLVRTTRTTLRDHGHEHKKMVGGIASAIGLGCSRILDRNRTNWSRRYRGDRGASATALGPHGGQRVDA
jgi:hypothetical protein